MKRSLNALSYALLGIGTIIATGIFSFLPFVYSIITGPSVVIALLLSGGTAALSALCYCCTLDCTLALGLQLQAQRAGRWQYAGRDKQRHQVEWGEGQGNNKRSNALV